ncbi:conserved hypothetical protein [Hyphomicrobiales bacterium]|nr:conserved hypothetical protein [Hyphomicrobiales bacterium]CAH1697143.1 conserved hypothetical protein [Hyphomicrobiales bacterium]CAI0342711.1 conserved hypothetical protein [Hyphomicrobiales bacterium]
MAAKACSQEKALAESLKERPLKIGHEFMSRGQRFLCVGVEDYLTLRDQWIDLFKLESVCADCRRPYSLKASMAAIRRYSLKRRCDRCKSPGVATRATKALQQKRAVQLVAQDYEALKAVRKATRPRTETGRGRAAARVSTAVDRPASTPGKGIPSMEEMFS